MNLNGFDWRCVRPVLPATASARTYADKQQQTNAASSLERMDDLLERRRTGAIITSFYHVYDELGFGFLESVYISALLLELTTRGIKAQREAPIDVYYRGMVVGHFRADLLVERKVIVEVKASLLVTEADRKQLLNYLRGTSLELGLLLHFGPKASFQRLIYTNKAR